MSFKDLSSTLVADLIETLTENHTPFVLQSESSALAWEVCLVAADPVENAAIATLVDGSNAWLDASRRETAIATIVISGQMYTCQTEILGPCVFDGSPAIRLSLPNYATKLQRREAFRIATPIIRPLLCIFTNENRSEPKAFPLRNLSVGGLQLLDEGERLAPTVGHIYTNCILELSTKDKLECRLEIRNVGSFKLHNGVTALRIGTRFVGLTAEQQAVVQRFIHKLEVEQARVKRD